MRISLSSASCGRNPERIFLQSLLIQSFMAFLPHTPSISCRINAVEKGCRSRLGSHVPRSGWPALLRACALTEALVLALFIISLLFAFNSSAQQKDNLETPAAAGQQHGIGLASDDQPEAVLPPLPAHPSADPFEETLERFIADDERQLSAPSLSQSERDRLQWLLENHERSLSDHRTNALLWRKVSEARVARDSKTVAQSQATLAEYLTKKLEAIDGKTYPSNMTLDKVMEIYDARAGRFAPFKHHKQLVEFLFLAIVVLPPVLFGIYTLRRNKVDHKVSF
jgi:hypothetical protein